MPSTHPDNLFTGLTSPAEVATKISTDAHAGGLNPNRGVDMLRLREAMEWSARQLLPTRERDADARMMYAGPRFGQARARSRNPLNMLRMAVNVWTRQLVSQDPKAIVVTRSQELQTAAYELELAINHLLKEIRFGATLTEVVQSAIFTMGIMKIGITSKYMSEASGFTADGGQPYAEPILIEDWLHDMNARRKEEWDWCGNRYRIPYDIIMQNPEYDKAAKAKLDPEGTDYAFDTMMAGGDLGGGASRSMARVSGGTDSIGRTEYRKHVELWDVYLPGDNLLVTFSAQADSKPLFVREWEGPEEGPYPILAFHGVPGSIIPTAPAQDLYEMQEMLTRLFIQLGRQANRQKTLTIVDGRAAADGTGENIMDAEDGQVIMTNHIDGVKEFHTGGVDPGNFQFVVWLREMMSYLGGNLDSMAGLSQQGKTLGQEELLKASSSEMLRDMQSKVAFFTKQTIKDLGYWLYTDPLIRLPLVKQIEGLGAIPFEYGPEKREADFYEYNFDVQPYSLQSQAPAQRLQFILRIFNEMILPLSPQLGEWGMIPDIRRLVELVSKYSDTPEIANLISSQQPLQGETTIPAGPNPKPTPGRRPLQSPTTTRNYVRENVSTGGTQASRDGDLMQSLASAAAQQGA